MHHRPQDRLDRLRDVGAFRLSRLKRRRRLVVGGTLLRMDSASVVSYGRILFVKSRMDDHNQAVYAFVKS
jgi:hypothetical protein